MSERIEVTERVTIYRRGKKNIYTADFWHSGQHRRQSLKTSNLKEARELALDLDHQIRNGDYAQNLKKVLVSEAVDQFLENKKNEGRAERTLTRYAGELRVFLEFLDRHRVKTLKQISPSLIDKYRSERLPIRQLSTVNHETEVIRQLLEWCVTRHHLSANPMSRMRFKKPKREPQPALKPGDLKQVMERATPRLRFILTTLMMTGCRIGELEHLLQEDVDLQEGWIEIVSRPGAETKTGCSRSIPIHPQLRELLLQKKLAPGPWYFCAEASDKYPKGDNSITPKRINEEFQALLKRAGLPVGRKRKGYTLHSLRHYFETQCVNSGVPQFMVDRWMGHSTQQSMGAVYYDNDDEKSQEFMRKVEF